MRMSECEGTLELWKNTGHKMEIKKYKQRNVGMSMWRSLKKEKLQGHEMMANTHTHTKSEVGAKEWEFFLLCESVCGCNGKLFLHTKHTFTKAWGEKT